MAIKVTDECWAAWGPVIKDLAAKFEFPADTFNTLNNYLGIFQGDGSTFRLEVEMWKIIFDTVRYGDQIVDIISVTLISKANDATDARSGWVITRPCPVHIKASSASPSPDINPENSIIGQKRDLRDKDHGTTDERTQEKEAPGVGGGVFSPRWIQIKDGGRVTDNCCPIECRGPFKNGKWKIYEKARVEIVGKMQEHEILRLREQVMTFKEKNRVLTDQLSASQNTFGSLQTKLSNIRRENRNLLQKSKRLSERRDFLESALREAKGTSSQSNLALNKRPLRNAAAYNHYTRIDASSGTKNESDGKSQGYHVHSGCSDPSSSINTVEASARRVVSLPLKRPRPEGVNQRHIHNDESTAKKAKTNDDGRKSSVDGQNPNAPSS